MVTPRLIYTGDAQTTLAQESNREADRQRSLDDRMFVISLRFAAAASIAEQSVFAVDRSLDLVGVRWAQDVALTASTANYYTLTLYRRRLGDQTALLRADSTGGFVPWRSYAFSKAQGSRVLVVDDVLTFSAASTGAPANLGPGMLELLLARRD